MTRLKFPVKSLFFTTLKQRVNQHFEQSGQDKYANKAMWAKAGVFLGGFIFCYVLIMSNILPLWLLWICSGLLGIFSAFVGFNVCHDAIHGSFSRNPMINSVLSSLFTLLGASPYIWNLTHNGIHHTFTNISGHDEDLIIAPGLIRIHKDDKKLKIQRFQHWYAFAVYGLASLSWVFRKDYMKIFKSELGSKNVSHPRKAYVKLFLSKALYYFLFIALPLIVLDITWWQFLIGFFTLHMGQGFTMGLVFQLAHVVEETSFPEPASSGMMDDNWAEHQLRTTGNFSSDSRMAAFFLGGLNRQIEHHLFPKICHIHYREIGKIVKQTAQEFGIPYLESENFFTATRSHFRLLRKFAREAA